MRLLVTSWHRFQRGPDSACWTDSAYPAAYWLPFLEVFDEVVILARVLPVAEPPPGGRRVDGPGIRIHPLPHAVGPIQYLRKRRAIRAAALAATRADDAVLLKVHSPLSNLVEPFIHGSGRRYGLKVIGDPWDEYSPGSTHHPARPLFQRLFAARLALQCSRAPAVAYVTAAALQRRYPPGPGAFSTHFTGVILPPAVWGPAPSRPQRSVNRLIHVGSMNLLYKGQDLLIEALALLRAAGREIELEFVGDGRARPELESLARERGVAAKIRFAGSIADPEQVFARLDVADLFVLPSRQEGLPRAMLEAMARELPCIGSTVGGIPELLPPEALVPAGDASALATRIAAFLDDPETMKRQGVGNRAVAARVAGPDNARRRREFLEFLRNGRH